MSVKAKNETEVYELRDPGETKEFYTDWAKSYEKDIKVHEYNGAYQVVQHFFKFHIPKTSRILDIGAGTGAIGQLLMANGYENMDALDGTPEMLEIAKQKNCYKNYIVSYVTPDIKLPVEDSTYDVVLMAGIFCPGHVRVEAFDQIIKVVKSGGLIFWSMGAHEYYAERDEQYQDLYYSNYLDSLCQQNKWNYMSGYPLRVKEYNRGKDGIIYAMKVQ